MRVHTPFLGPMENASMNMQGVISYETYRRRRVP